MREKFREKKRWGKKDRFRLNPARMSKQVCVVQKAGRFPIRPFYFILFYFILFYFFVFLGLHPQHMEVPRLGTKLELQLPAYTTATVTPIRPFYFIFLLFTAAPASYGASQARGPIRAAAASLQHISWQYQILNPLSEARDWTHNLIISSQICFCCATTGTPIRPF